uniref:Uncharacterized protein n=1 Tax=Anguilla anguilla TaxID=7936 RepID=A0A0E9RU14_ANGAN
MQLAITTAWSLTWAQQSFLSIKSSSLQLEEFHSAQDVYSAWPQWAT